MPNCVSLMETLESRPRRVDLLQRADIFVAGSGRFCDGGDIFAQMIERDGNSFRIHPLGDS